MNCSSWLGSIMSYPRMVPSSYLSLSLPGQNCLCSHSFSLFIIPIRGKLGLNESILKHIFCCITLWVRWPVCVMVAWPRSIFAFLLASDLSFYALSSLNNPHCVHSSCLNPLYFAQFILYCSSLDTDQRWLWSLHVKSPVCSTAQEVTAMEHTYHSCLHYCFGNRSVSDCTDIMCMRRRIGS